jgi:CPA2 family monovalent cation:H+ antiporter-2
MDVDPMLVTLAAGFTLAVLLGVFAHRLGLSPILGYLVAGISIGPHMPASIADPHLAAQLAEVGIILLMFGVGLHFHLDDLLAVKSVAVPGALIVCAYAATLGTLVGVGFGWSWGSAIMLGLAISVASTVVLVRVLMSKDMLETPHGHVAVGWLIVEDLITVFALVLLPAAAAGLRGEGTDVGFLLGSLGVALAKLAGLILLVAYAGRRLIPPLLSRVARTRSRELFTLSVLAIALAVAALAAVVFGASPALGAFLAGMVVAGSAVRHQAAADALPLRDAFAVLFFVSAGMQFDPNLLVSHPGLLLAILGIVLVGKPVAALVVVLALGWSMRTALTVGFGVAQIGEFSFILATLGQSLNLLPHVAASAIVTTALITIALNPWLMDRMEPVERWLRRRPRLWETLNRRAERRARALAPPPPRGELPGRRALVVGFGPTGQAACAALEVRGIEPVVVESNVDTVQKLAAEGRRAVYGDARRAEVLASAGLVGSVLFLVTSTAPELAAQAVVTARGLDPSVRIIVRTRYLSERDTLLALGASSVTVDEEAVSGGLVMMLLREMDVDAAPTATTTLP